MRPCNCTGPCHHGEIPEPPKTESERIAERITVIVEMRRAMEKTLRAQQQKVRETEAALDKINGDIVKAKEEYDAAMGWN